MARQVLNPNSVSPNDRLGDTPFDYTAKLNGMTQELYGLTGDNNTVYLRSESDLPNKTATTWTMDQNVPYKLAATFSTNLQTIPATGASLRCDNLGSFVFSFTGTGAMFKGIDVDFFINNITIDPGIANTAFEFNDSVGGIHIFIAHNVAVKNCAVWGKFTDMLLSQALNCSGGNSNQGIQFFGTANVLWSFDRIVFSSASATFKCIDFGTATATIIEFDDLFISSPVGGVGFSGLANSGNVPIGRLGRVRGCEFLGGMSDLSGLSVDDTRWLFRDNSPTADTFPDALIAFRSNTTETVIVTQDVPVLVAGTWIEEQASLFSTTAAGKVTYLAERPIKAPVTISAGLISVGGGSVDVTLYLAKNGTIITASGVKVEISGSKAQTFTIPWQLTYEQNNFTEVFVENNTNTTNILVEFVTQRVL